ncbi:MAG: PAS domain S-box protein [Dehalococcoidia bacterium]|nr:PAS domain S-box protein [Dehalococcoidia bacterium]
MLEARSGAAAPPQEGHAHWEAQVVASALEAIIMVDRHGRIHAANPVAHTMLGVSSLSGRNIADFLPPLFRAGHRELVLEFVESGPIARPMGAHLPVPVLRADGTEFFADVSLVRVMVDGEPGAACILRDLTERRRIEARICLQARLLDQGTSAAIAFDTTGAIVYWSPAAERLYGRTASAVVGRRLPELAIFQSAGGAFEAARDAVRAGSTWESELVARDTAGRTFPVRLTVAPVRGDSGELLGAVAHSHDISEQQQTKQLLAAQAALFAQVASEAPLDEVFDSICRMVEGQSEGVRAAIFVVDPSGDTLRVGAAPSVPHAWSRLEGLHVGPRTTPCGVAAFFGVPVTVDDILNDPNWAHIRHAAAALGLHACFSNPVLARSGEVLGIVTTYFDRPRRPTEREQQLVAVAVRIVRVAIERRVAEEARLAVEQRLRTVTENARMLFFSVDREGIVTMAEGYALKLMGVTGESLIGRRALDCFPSSPETRSSLEEALAGAERTASMTFGSRVYETRLTPVLGLGGEVTGVAGVALDVTEQRRAESSLLHAQKVESLAVLAGGMAHDFNNILTAILGNASIARALLPPGSPATELLDEVEHSGRRAADLAQQMLAYAGKAAAAITRVSLNELVRDTVQLLRVSMGAHLHISVALDADLPLVVADATQVRQVVMNLLINASDAIGSEPGSIRVSTGRQMVSRKYLNACQLGDTAEPGPCVFIEVADTGPGMDESTRQRIFEPFFTTKFTGRGLGLAAVLGICRTHRGAIRLTTSPGTGTRFRVLLPESQPL